ncbi:DUF3418 domain-containing protein, partial [Salmonella enterica]|uniref:DUF3418 domain-containing protein n=1 Tax=Salmonella enterica TaxID=28901 RepID=UPI000A91E9DE
EWVDRVARPLINRSYGDPQGGGARGGVGGTKKVTVSGLPFAAARKVNYSQIARGLCRGLFPRHGVGGGDG